MIPVGFVPVSVAFDTAMTLTGIPEKTLRAAVKAGDLPRHWHSERGYVFLVEDLTEFVRNLPTDDEREQKAA